MLLSSHAGEKVRVFGVPVDAAGVPWFAAAAFSSGSGYKNNNIATRTNYAAANTLGGSKFIFDKAGGVFCAAQETHVLP